MYGKKTTALRKLLTSALGFNLGVGQKVTDFSAAASSSLVGLCVQFSTSSMVLHLLKSAGLCSELLWVDTALENPGRADSEVRDAYYSSCHAVKPTAQLMKAEQLIPAIFNS